MPAKKKPAPPAVQPLESRPVGAPTQTVILSQSVPLSQFGAPIPGMVENLRAVLDHIGATITETIPGAGAVGLVNGVDPDEVIIAEMTDEQITQLSTNKPASVTIEVSQPVSFAMEELPACIDNPAVMQQAFGGFSTTVEVLGTDGPLEGVEVFAYGGAWPVREVTDAAGKVTLHFLGSTPEQIKSMHVKPADSYWSRQFNAPNLVRDGVQTVQLDPIAMPEGQDTPGWGLQAIGVDRLPPNTLGQGIKVAVIDSGIPEDHPEFETVTSGEDIIGKVANGWKWSGSHHGAHCAGVIAAASNAAGMRSVAPGAELFISRIFPGPQTEHLVRAIKGAVAAGADVISMSLGMANDSPVVAQAIRFAKAQGVATIAAAGNSAGEVMFPARMPEVLCVSAIGLWGTFPATSSHAGQIARDSAGNYEWVGQNGHFFARFSCFGHEVDLCGPGVAVNSAVPPDGFAPMDGTSMACPHIAGAAALVLAHNPDFVSGRFAQRSPARVDALFARLKSACRPLPGLGGEDRVGAGLVDVTQAILPSVAPLQDTRVPVMA